jgi:hypothetical protein
LEAKNAHRPKNRTNSHSVVKEKREVMPSLSRRAGRMNVNENAKAEIVAEASKLRCDESHRGTVKSAALRNANIAFEIPPIEEASPDRIPSLRKGVSYTAH